MLFNYARSVQVRRDDHRTYRGGSWKSITSWLRRRWVWSDAVVAHSGLTHGFRPVLGTRDVV